MTEEQKTQFIKELSRKCFDNGGYVLRQDVMALLEREGIGDDSSAFEDLVNDLSDNGIEYHEDAKEAISSEEPDVENMTEEELEEENLDYPDDVDDEEISDEETDFDLTPASSDESDSEEDEDEEDEDYDETEDVDNDAPPLSSWTNLDDEHIGSGDHFVVLVQ